MGCKLLEIMADGLYSVFHRFEAFLKKRLTHKQRVLDGHPTAVVLLQSLLFLLQPLKQAPAGLPAPSSPRPAVLSCRPHRPLLFLLLARPCGDGSLTPQPNQGTHVLLSARASTAASSPAPCHPLPRPRRRPLPWCSRRGVVNVVNDIPSEEYCTWRG